MMAGEVLSRYDGAIDDVYLHGLFCGEERKLIKQ